jgi:cell division protein FtsB
MRKIVTYFIIFFQILLIISLVRGIYETFQSRERIATLASRKEMLEAKRQELQQKMSEVESPLYLEKVARDELHLSKPGETVVIVPEGKLNILAVNQPNSGDSEEKPNYMRWWDVVSGKIN